MSKEERILERAKVFHALAHSHLALAAQYDAANLPPECGEYERGKADAYEICAETLTHITQEICLNE